MILKQLNHFAHIVWERRFDGKREMRRGMFERNRCGVQGLPSQYDVRIVGMG
jgi:hypothetical protein